MPNLHGSRYSGAKRMFICDGVIEGFGSLMTAPPGFRLDQSGRLWERGSHRDHPSGLRMTEDGEIVEDDDFAEGAGSGRHYGPRLEREGA